MKRIISTLLVIIMVLCTVPMITGAMEEPGDEASITNNTQDLIIDDSDESDEITDVSNDEQEDIEFLEDDLSDEENLFVESIEDEEIKLDTLTTVIGVNTSSELIAALENDSPELTIDITNEIVHQQPIELGRDNQAITINLGGKEIFLSVSGTAILIRDGVSLTINGPGTLNILCVGSSSSAYSRGIEVQGTGSVFAITGGAVVNTEARTVGAGSYDAIGVYAHSGGSATVTSALATGVRGFAAMTVTGGTINIKGNAAASSTGMSYGVAAWGGTINVSGSVYGNYIGAEARDDGLINIAGNLAGTGNESIGSYGALVRSGGKIFVTGNISGIRDDIVINHANWITRSVSNPTRPKATIIPPQHGYGYYWDEFTHDNSAVVYKQQGELDPALINDFVSRLYRNVLEREPDAGGLRNWSNGLRNGSVTGAQIAYNFYFCSERLSKQPMMSDEQYIDNLYVTMLGRKADRDGRARWADGLSNGLSKLEVLKLFIGSKEFADMCAKAVIAVGDPEPPQDVKIRAFVARLYEKCLGRAPDAQGLESWSGALQGGHRTGTQLGREFILCEEFENRQLSNGQFVDILYNAFYGRPADADGRAGWINALNAGRTRVNVYNSFAGAKEFGDICDAYGIRP